MFDISILAVVLAALSTFVIGAIWYGPLFLKTWQREAGISQDDMGKRHPAFVFGGAFVLNLFAAYIFGHVLATYGHPELKVDVLIALGLATGFVVTAFGVNYLFAGRSLKLFSIDAGYFVVSYIVMGAIFGFLD